jgi:hypothetical protein
MGCLGIILLWIVSIIGVVFPPLGIIILVIFLIWSATGQEKSKGTGARVHHSKIIYPPCCPFDYEIDEDGMVWAQPYFDKRGRKRYCCNPNHTHFFS